MLTFAARACRKRRVTMRALIDPAISAFLKHYFTDSIQAAIDVR
jgi:hypothetical protein